MIILPIRAAPQPQLFINMISIFLPLTIVEVYTGLGYRLRIRKARIGDGDVYPN